MRPKSATALLLGALVLPLSTGATSLQELVKVEIKDAHLCCGACVNAINKAVGEVDGAKADCDEENGTITPEAKDMAAAQQAVDAIAEAGYHGSIEADTPKFPEITDVPEGKVESLKLDGIHNCCGGCTSAVVEALETVEGVDANTLKPRMKAFEVTGDFEASAVIEALNAAGFHVKVAM